MGSGCQDSRPVKATQPHAERYIQGAATSVAQQGEKIPIYADYQRLVESGTKPNLAKLTLARKIAAIMLRIWKDEEVYPLLLSANLSIPRMTA